MAPVHYTPIQDEGSFYSECGKVEIGSEQMDSILPGQRIHQEDGVVNFRNTRGKK